MLHRKYTYEFIYTLEPKTALIQKSLRENITWMVFTLVRHCVSHLKY